MHGSWRNFSILAVGLVALSQSANLIRLGDAHPVAITAWRLLMAGLVLALLAGRRLASISRLTRLDLGMLAAAGLLLSLHLFTWIAAVQRTQVANATIFFSMNPVITAVAGYFLLRETVTKWLSASVLLGLLGVGVIGWHDISLSGNKWSGDALAIVSAALFSGYFLLGKFILRKIETVAYVACVYTIAALIAFAFLFALRLPLVAYSPKTWLCFALMAVVPTFIGHSLLNRSLRYFIASRVAAATMSEPILATVVAYFAWNEPVYPTTFVGFGLICASVLLLALDMRQNA